MKKLTEVFKLDEVGWTPVSLETEEWMVVDAALQTYRPKTSEERKLVDSIKKKLQVVSGEHGVDSGRQVDLDKYMRDNFPEKYAKHVLGKSQV